MKIDSDSVIDFVAAAENTQAEHGGFGWMVHEPVEFDPAKLVLAARHILKDEQLPFCAAIEKPVQDVVIGDKTYELSIQVKIKSDE